MYRHVLSSASEQLKLKHKKLGKCVDRARPFYLANRDARQVSLDFWQERQMVDYHTSISLGIGTYYFYIHCGWRISCFWELFVL